MREPRPQARVAAGRRRALGLLLAGLAGLLAGPARAQRLRERARGGDGPGRPIRPDRQELREAVRRGEIRPLRELMAAFEEKTGHEILDVTVRKVGGDYLYGFKVLTAGGRVARYVMHAGTGEIMTLRDARARYR